MVFLCALFDYLIVVYIGGILKFTNHSEYPEILQFEAADPRSIQDIEEFNRKSISSLICKASEDLRKEFSSHGSCPFITIDQWNNGLSRVLSLDIEWKDALDVKSFKDLQDYILTAVGYKDSWPPRFLFIPCEHFTLLSRLILARHTYGDREIAFDMWNKVILSLSSALLMHYL